MAPGGLFLGIFLPLTAHPASSVSKSSVLPQNVLFFFLQSASLTICSTMRSKQGRGFGDSGKPLSSLFLRFFFNPGGCFFFWRWNQGFTFSPQTPGAAFGQRCHSRHGALAPFSVMNPPQLLHPRDSGIYKQSLVDHFVFSSVALGSVWRWGWGSPDEAEF